MTGGTLTNCPSHIPFSYNVGRFQVLVTPDYKCDIKHFILLGMKEYGRKLYSNPKCFNNYIVLPELVKTAFSELNAGNFD